MENPSYKNKNIERKYLNDMRKNQFFMVANSLLELEKDFIKLKNRKLKDGKLKMLNYSAIFWTVFCVYRWYE